ncbi:hypothetical protein GcC1_040006 [Golovinomyces cichoracearum]|uniref:DUF3752 domain-containing protein n=1 Tax=Golovinomyces cichoracearum TaxID=62708 RepID=A0A420IZN3_9PEZI|nr:hypothetical protein GcC1_040006 [Golovinomyces cichoracearum]
MPLIGPEMPSHLTSRKRTTDSIHPEGSPPPPRRVRLSPSLTTGPYPTQPSHQKQQTETSEEGNLYPRCPKNLSPTDKSLSHSEEDNFKVTSQSTNIPEVPAESTQHSEADHFHEPNTAYLDNQLHENESIISAPTAPRRILGPAVPSLSQVEFGSQSVYTDKNIGNESSSDSDDEYGPSLPPDQSSNLQDRPSEMVNQEQLPHHPIYDNKVPESSLKRAEWMLTPPTSSDWTTRIDPTRLKNRKFAMGKGVKGPVQKSGVSSIWTETPEEKSKRLEDEVLGRTQVDSSSSVTATHLNRSGRDFQEKEIAATELIIREYNKDNRSKSLLDERTAAQERGELKKLEDDDPSKRAFDREKDMALGSGHIATAKRKQVIAGAVDIANRFEKGSYL